MDGFEFDVLDEISHSFEQLALEKIDSATFDDNVTKLKELTSKATTVLSDIKNEVSLINASKEYNQHVLSKIDVVRENERKEYNELLLVLKDERQRYNELKSRLIELENKYKSSCPDHTLMTKVLREQMQWQTALESTLLETSKLKHEYKLAKQKIFELQQENIIKIEHSRMFYEFLKAALKIAVLEVTPSRSTLVIAPLEKEDKWMLIDTDSASRDSLWRLLAERLLLLTLPELSGQEHNLRNFRRVVLYKRDRKCPICDLKVHQAVPDWESDICEHAWRYIHGFSQTIKCGLYYYMKFTNYQSLRDEQRKLLNKNSINTISDTNNSLIGTNITTSSDNSTENLEKSTDI